MSIRLRLDNIQGNVTPGFRSSHQAFMFIRFPGRPAATAWLGELQPEITSAQEVARFLLERRQPWQESAHTSATWANVAFSWLGLQCLGAPSLDAFPDEFRSGMYGRAARLGDDHRAVAEWEVGGSPETEAHAMLVLAAGSREDLEGELDRQTARLASHNVDNGAVRSYIGQRLPGEMRGREHFGFMDGVSQPRLDIAGETRELEDHMDLVKPGEFILGYPDEDGETRAQPAWTRDGSYASFRRFRQNVARFRQIVEREAEMLGLSPQQLAAKLVGRWPSGAKLGGEARDPAERQDLDPATVLIDQSDFANDSGGERTPRFAHIRKAYPRDETGSEPLRHRLLRRGIPYGDPLPPGVLEDDGQDRGLLFLAYQASLARQLEHLQERWFNNPDFPRPGDGPDPLVGQPPGPHELKLRHEGGGVSTLRLDRFVSVTAGGYFFAPSIRALAYLAGRSTQWNEEDNMAYQGNSDLGDLIFDENPYGQGSGQLRPGFQSVCEIDDELISGTSTAKDDGFGRRFGSHTAIAMVTATYAPSTY